MCFLFVCLWKIPQAKSNFNTLKYSVISISKNIHCEREQQSQLPLKEMGASAPSYFILDWIPSRLFLISKPKPATVNV